MSNTTDPNELAPLTELGNRTVQERIRKMREFASSSKWAASAFVLELAESMGFHARVGFELRTPLDEPFQDVITGWGPNREDAVRNAVAEWLDLALPAALAIHSDKDPHARLGEIQIGDHIFAWRMAPGLLRATGPDADTATAELAQSDLFQRLNLPAALPLQRDLPWFCIKLRLARTADPPPVPPACSALLNNADWPAGRELLQRFVLPGIKPLEIKQYLFLRRTARRVASAPTAVPRPAHAHASAPKIAPPRKPWWKVW